MPMPALLENALEGAVARGEISAWYQPQVDLETGDIVGVEALCRWQNPELGFVPPVDFIPAAEDTGAIDEIGRYMAEQCCDALAEWSRPGRDLSVAVNVSPVQLTNAAFTDWLAAEYRRRRVAHGSLTVEITESRPIDDVASVVPRLDRLRALGVGIAIDDFGAGQASLSQLRRLHGTELKIDRALVQDVSPRSTQLIAEAIEIGHASGIRIVAEGVETRAHLDRVADLGCDRAQGYLIGRPMPREAMASRLANA
jgi:EAL domain-containing protein (putative c-di-GMP-specific phosphodiesterase class I)